MPNSLTPLEAELLAALKGLSDMYAWTWDRTDGCLVMLGKGVQRFEDAHEIARAAIARASGEG